MRSFVTSVSGPRSSPDPIRFCAQCASSARRRSDSSTICDPRSLRLLPHHRPASDAKLLISTVAATAISSIANPRRHPAVNHDPLRSLDVLSARGERAHPRVLRGPSGSRNFYPRHRSSSTGVSPPTSHQHRAHRFAWWSPLLVPGSGFNELQRPRLAFALGGLSLLFRSVYVINFVLGFAVLIASISTTFSSAASVGNWLHQKTAISYMFFFHLHHLLGYFGRH
jgi:hypothetical protein